MSRMTIVQPEQMPFTEMGKTRKGAGLGKFRSLVLHLLNLIGLLDIQKEVIAMRSIFESRIQRSNLAI